MSNPNERQVTPTNIGFLAGLVRQARLTWRLLTDNRVPLWLKGIIPATLLYVISPVDLLPDVVPVLGQMDDLAVVAVGLKLFIDLCPPAIVQEHLKALIQETGWKVEKPESSSADVIDGSYEVKKD